MEEKNNGGQPVFNPHGVLHLCGGCAIAKIFGVSRATVAQWKAMGAPIFRVGKKDQASYPELWGWLKSNAAES